jgi:hypothetical protein
VLADHLDGVEDSEQLGGVGLRKGANPLDEGRADQPEEPAGEGVPGNGTEVRGQAGSLLADCGAQLCQVGGGLLRTRGVLHHALPLRIGPEHRLAQRIPQDRGDRVTRWAIGIPRPDRLSCLLRGPAALPAR